MPTFYLILVMVLICMMPNYVHYSDVLDDTTTIHRELLKYKDAKLLEAMIQVESSFNKNAVSNKNAQGLMQIRPEVWHTELVKVGIIKNRFDYFDIEKNIQAGNYILSKYKVKGKITEATLAKYSGNANNYAKKVYNIKRRGKNERRH